MIDLLFSPAGGAKALSFGQIADVSQWFSAAGWSWWHLLMASVLAAVIIGWSVISKGIGGQISTGGQTSTGSQGGARASGQHTPISNTAPAANGGLSGARRGVIALLQWLFMTVLLLMLWQPAVRIDSLVKGDNTIAVLIDGSRSMLLPADATSSQPTRLQAALQALNNTAGFDTSLLEQLGQDFTVSVKTFDRTVQTIGDDDLSGLASTDRVAGEATRVKQALLDTAAEASQSLLAGVIVLSDGADTDTQETTFWQSLRASSVPVYTVGLGALEHHDLMIADVDMPASAPADTLVTAQLQLRYSVPGSTVLRVTRDDQLLYSGRVDLPEGKTDIRHNVRIRTGEPGASQLEFSVETQENEVSVVNNQYRQPLWVSDKKPRVLYIEGEPRWEYKFLRRAVTASSPVDVVSLLYTSPNKFYRQGVSGRQELEAGFPTDAETLFEYDAIIIGSLDSALLSVEQHQLIQDFVRIRGGSLLLLAGAKGIDDGGWSRTAVGQALPMTAATRDTTYRRERTALSVTQAGAAVDWLSLSDNSDPQSGSNPSGNGSGNQSGNQSGNWATLPKVADIQSTGTLKPGATVWVAATTDDRYIPVLTWQRYGRGRTFVLATSGTWRWQMSLPATDQRHELFWSGLLGELADGVLPGIVVSGATRVVRDNDTLALSIDARSGSFAPSANPVRIKVTGPNNVTQAVTAQADPAVPGRYLTNVSMPRSGLYTLEVMADDTESTDNKHTTQLTVLREADTAEDYALVQNKAFLSEVARVTGGQYLTPGEVGQIPALVAGHSATQTRQSVYPLWQLPLFFLVLVLLKIGEWLLRRGWNRL